MSAWHRFDPRTGRVTLTIHVQPNASASAVAGLHGDALKIRIAAPAVDHKANRALIAFLHRVLQLRASQISIRHGAHGRRKIVEIADADVALLARLETIAER
jgi:uncharacterized protein (TIGR00251 family)